MAFRTNTDTQQERKPRAEDSLACLDITLIDGTLLDDNPHNPRKRLGSDTLEVVFLPTSHKRIELELGDGRIVSIGYEPARVSAQEPKPEPIPVTRRSGMN